VTHPEHVRVSARPYAVHWPTPIRLIVEVTLRAAWVVAVLAYAALRLPELWRDEPETTVAPSTSTTRPARPLPSRLT